MCSYAQQNHTIHSMVAGDNGQYSLRWQVQSAAQEAAVQRLVQLYARIHISTPQGFYLAALELYTPGAKESSLSLLVVDKFA